MSQGDADPVIEVRGVSKVYRVFRQFGRGWLLSTLLPFVDRNRFSREVHALSDINFSVERGEILGIIGRNASGKTSLLQLVAGISWPTRGEIIVRGKIRALLSLGVNFHPSFRARDNILFGSLAMGIPRKQALKRVDEILDFAELREYGDMPLQYYSSGMRSRLAAAVSFQEAAEILMVDEALAAGDSYFVSKCLNRIEDLCNGGSTVLFVSHGISLVERLCSRALLLDGGRLVEQGDPSKVVNAYRRILVSHQEAMVRKAGLTAPIVTLDAKHPSDDMIGQSAVVEAADVTEAVPTDGVTGTGLIQLQDIYMCGVDGKRRMTFDHGEEVQVHIHFRAQQRLPQVRFFLELYSQHYGVKVAEIGSSHLSAETGSHGTFYPQNLEGDYHLSMRMPANPLGSGEYYWNLYFAPPAGQMKYNIESLFHCRAYRVHPFMSYSFPGMEWAKSRKALLEPAVEFALEAKGGEVTLAQRGVGAIR